PGDRVQDQLAEEGWDADHAAAAGGGPPEVPRDVERPPGDPARHGDRVPGVGRDPDPPAPGGDPPSLPGVDAHHPLEGVDELRPAVGMVVEGAPGRVSDGQRPDQQLGPSGLTYSRHTLTKYREIAESGRAILRP